MALTGKPFIPGTDVGSAESGGVLNIDLVAGAASGVLLTLSRIRPGDIVISALMAPSAAGLMTDRTADLVSIGASGGLTFGGESTAAAQLIVQWLDKVPA